MHVLGVLRGRPGLGHVTPGLALLESCARAGAAVSVCTYGNGTRLLADVEWDVHDLEIDGPYFAWAGLNLIDDVCLKLRPIVERTQPDLIVAGGEYLLPLAAGRWGAKLVMIYNPEVLVAKRHNEALRDLFVDSFSACDLLVCQAPPPANDELWPEAVPLVRDRSVYFGPLLRQVRGRQPRAEGPLRVVISNGGGVLLPENSITYSAGGADPTVWAQQSYDFVVEAIGALTEEMDVVVDAFFCGGRAHEEALRAACAHATNIRVHAFSLGYADLLAQADLAICRAGASSLAEIDALGVRALVWPLPNHAEQERSVTELERKNPAVKGVWRFDELDRLIHRAMQELRAAGSRNHRQLLPDRVMDQYLSRLMGLVSAGRRPE